MTDRKRDVERVIVPGEVTGEVSVYQALTIMNLSDRGAQVETSFPLLLGSLHDFRFSLNGLSVIVKGRIVHSQIGGLDGGAILYRTGVELVEVSEHALAAIRTFVETHKLSIGEAPVIIDAEIADEI
jgi:PilZ domain-containing protein